MKRLFASMFTISLLCAPALTFADGVKMCLPFPSSTTPHNDQCARDYIDALTDCCEGAEGEPYVTTTPPFEFCCGGLDDIDDFEEYVDCATDAFNVWDECTSQS